MTPSPSLETTTLLRVVQDLSRARDLEGVMRIVRTAARELTGADGATFVLRDGDRCHYADEDGIGPLWKGQRFPMADCVSGWAMLHGQAAAIEDIEADPRIPLESYRATFVKSLVMTPIRAADPIGAIGVYWAEKRRATDEQIALVAALADSTSVALENVRLLGALEARVAEATAALAAAREAEEDTRREMAARLEAQEALLRAEQRLRQSQKMDAVGQLAGGIAHDFNNLLSVILGYSQTILADLKPSDPLRADLEEIQRAGERAARLTRQILTFGRQQVLEPRLVRWAEVIRGIEPMLRRLIGESIRFEVLQSGEDGWSVLSDAGQLEQVVVNLVINARDAMPDGGKITIETKNVFLDEAYAALHAGVEPGAYAMIAVSDDGAGMDAETRSRIFEPFFTTKPQGKGTGLGLATVYGIVKQSRGHVWVYSEVGCGTTFRIYLPRAEVEVAAAPAPRTVPGRLTGTETILLVEDDDQVRALARGILRRAGYNVLQVRNAGEALLFCEQHPQTIHLLLTDVVMPQMSGPRLARRLLATRPDMRVLCMSGYADEAALQHGIIDSELAFLQKPLTPDGLLTRVRQVLDA